jgi:hypothetical protein
LSVWGHRRSRPSPQCYTPESSELLKPAITTAIETGSLYKIELEMIRADGTSYWTG